MRGEDVCFEALMPESGPAGNHPLLPFRERTMPVAHAIVDLCQKQLFVGRRGTACQTGNLNLSVP